MLPSHFTNEDSGVTEPRAYQLGDLGQATFPLCTFISLCVKRGWSSGLLSGFTENLVHSGDSIKPQIRSFPLPRRPGILSWIVTSPRGAFCKWRAVILIVTKIGNPAGIWGRGPGCLSPALGMRVPHSKVQGRRSASLQALKCLPPPAKQYKYK